MAKYTIKIKDMLRNGWKPPLDEYPIFDESHRETLNDKIINHYYMSEIGYETVALFDHFLKVKMNEIMDEYNQMYKIQEELMKSINVKYMEKYRSKGNVESESNNESSSKSSSDGENRFLDTPQNNLKNIENYLTNATLDNAKSDSSNKSSGGSKTDDEREYTKEIIDGNKDMEKLKNAMAQVVNIDMMIIRELECLFMGIL